LVASISWVIAYNLRDMWWKVRGDKGGEWGKVRALQWQGMILRSIQ
jgi:hypothetical protein